LTDIAFWPYAMRLWRAQLVFNHRFQPFLQLASPEPLSYSRFRESVDATNLDVRTDRQYSVRSGRG